ncbi:MAG: radical SAM protein, partial [Dehalococcoidales bacterium]
GGCGLRCSWCDSLFAVLPEEIKKYRKMMTTAQILDAIEKLPSAPYITFTGGDPCIQPLLDGIINTLNMRGMRIAVETQGQYFPDWLRRVDVATFSPKGPSSGNVVDISDLLEWLHERGGIRTLKVCIKIVCFNEDDYKYALFVYNSIPSFLYDAFYFTAGTPLIKTPMHQLPQDKDDLTEAGFARVEMVLQNQHNLATMMLKNDAQTEFNDKVHLGCQQHVLLWPTEDKGV